MNDFTADNLWTFLFLHCLLFSLSIMIMKWNKQTQEDYLWNRWHCVPVADSWGFHNSTLVPIKETGSLFVFSTDVVSDPLLVHHNSLRTQTTAVGSIPEANVTTTSGGPLIFFCVEDRWHLLQFPNISSWDHTTPWPDSDGRWQLLEDGEIFLA